MTDEREQTQDESAASAENNDAAANSAAKPAPAKRIGRDRFALKNSVVFGVAVVMLFTLGIVLLPGEKLGGLLIGHKGTDARNLGNALFRAAGFVVLVLLALDLGFDIFRFRGRARGFLWAAPFLIVVLNNAPFIGLATGKVTVAAGGVSYFLFALSCIAVGLFEEIVFRGVVFPLILGKMKNDRKGIFWAVVISSALFGAVHLVNLFSSDPLAVLAQIGYSFLIGAMCAMVLLLCRNIFACALLHASFNFCGLLAEELGSGPVWDLPTILLTVAVALAALGYWVYLMRKRVQPLFVKRLYTLPWAND